MTLADKKIDDLLEYFYDNIYEKNGDIEYSDFKNWLRKALAEAKKIGFDNGEGFALLYYNKSDKEYIRIRKRKLKELEAEKCK